MVDVLIQTVEKPQSFRAYDCIVPTLMSALVQGFGGDEQKRWWLTW